MRFERWNDLFPLQSFPFYVFEPLMGLNLLETFMAQALFWVALEKTVDE